MEILNMIKNSFSIFALLLFVSCSSYPPELGMVGDKLRPCPSSPNCWVTFYAKEDPEHFYPPYKSRNIKATRQQLRYYLSTLDNVEVVTAGPQYLHATFESDFFGFIDDFEAYFDPDEKILHMRSASRTGHSDFGVNKERLDALVLFLRRQR